MELQGNMGEFVYNLSIRKDFYDDDSKLQMQQKKRLINTTT